MGDELKLDDIYYDCYYSEEHFKIEDHRAKWETRMNDIHPDNDCTVYHSDSCSNPSSDGSMLSENETENGLHDMESPPDLVTESESSDEEPVSDESSDSESEIQVCCPCFPAVPGGVSYQGALAASKKREQVPSSFLKAGKSILVPNYLSLFGRGRKAKRVSVSFGSSETVKVESLAEGDIAWVKPRTSHNIHYKWTDEIRGLNIRAEEEKAHIRAIALHECVDIEGEDGEWMKPEKTAGGTAEEIH